MSIAWETANRVLEYCLASGLVALPFGVLAWRHWPGQWRGISEWHYLAEIAVIAVVMGVSWLPFGSTSSSDAKPLLWAAMEAVILPIRDSATKAEDIAGLPADDAKPLQDFRDLLRLGWRGLPVLEEYKLFRSQCLLPAQNELLRRGDTKGGDYWAGHRLLHDTPGVFAVCRQGGGYCDDGRVVPHGLQAGLHDCTQWWQLLKTKLLAVIQTQTGRGQSDGGILLPHALRRLDGTGVRGFLLGCSENEEPCQWQHWLSSESMTSVWGDIAIIASSWFPLVWLWFALWSRWSPKTLWTGIWFYAYLLLLPALLTFTVRIWEDYWNTALTDELVHDGGYQFQVGEQWIPVMLTAIGVWFSPLLWLACILLADNFLSRRGRD